MLKRTFDFLSALAALVAMSPFLILLAILVRWKLGAPVLFKQPRLGCQGRIFLLYKFRTMTEARDPAGRLLPDDQRLTPFGRWLRSSSFDEWPELWNILRGDMSVVGPRPLLVKYRDRYSKEQFRRHEVRPGLTGWAQVNGRNATTWEERLAADVWYVDHQTFRLDCRIIFLTVLAVVRREGISAEGHSTMPEFMGASTTRQEKSG